jgi:nitrile hydratase
LTDNSDHDHGHPNTHQHTHEHPHTHESSPQAIRAEALESLLIEKGLLKASDVDDVIVQYEERVGPMNGARVVARAWKDPSFKQRLLADGTSAIEDFAFEGGQTEKLVVVANGKDIHNVVVCTLCSCYPWAVLGLPPKWYKDPAYRSRIVREPRKVLTEMGLALPTSTNINVWDSSAEVRYMVLPEQPDGTEDLSEEELAHKVSRDAMIGVAHL